MSDTPNRPEGSDPQSGWDGQPADQPQPDWGSQPAPGQPADPPPSSGGWSQPAAQGGWGEGQPAGPPAKTTNGLAIAALVVGILAMVTFFFVVTGVIGGIIAIILGFLGIRRARTAGSGKGMAIGGIVTGVLGLLGGIAIVAFGAWIFSFFMNYADDFQAQNPDCTGAAFETPECQARFEQYVEDQLTDRFGQ